MVATARSDHRQRSARGDRRAVAGRCGGVPGRADLLLIVRHEAQPGGNGQPPFVFSQVVFAGRQGHLSLELWGRDQEAAGQIVPDFFSRSGERHEIPARFAAAVRAATKGVTSLGCKSAQFTRAPEITADASAGAVEGAVDLQRPRQGQSGSSSELAGDGESGSILPLLRRGVST